MIGLLCTLKHKTNGNQRLEALNCVPYTGVNAFHILSHLIYVITHKNSFLWTVRLRHRDVTSIVKGHTAKKW